ncbi:hypothetical protein Slala05_67270 [Streptomyces lavendulae subsp. lavendulae]|nr:hypothetical protein Slala05_67270 [Streptomyces lavendulae subsp. lavendulae]
MRTRDLRAPGGGASAASAPSGEPAFTEFLAKAGIDSISVAPDSSASVKQHVATTELKRYGEGRTAPSRS